MRADLYQKIANDILPPELKEAGDKLIKQVNKVDYAEEDLPKMLRMVLGFLMTLACLGVSLYFILHFDLNMARSNDEALKSVGIIIAVAVPFMFITFHLLFNLLNRTCSSLVKKRNLELRYLLKNNPDAKRAALIIIDEIEKERKEDLFG